MITEEEADAPARLDRGGGRARARGCSAAATRDGAMLEATLLEDVPRGRAVVCKEAFGPVAVLSRFRDFDAALAQVNDSDFGLQAGIFTRDLYRAQRAWDALEVGGVRDRRRARRGASTTCPTAA